MSRLHSVYSEPLASEGKMRILAGKMYSQTYIYRFEMLTPRDGTVIRGAVRRATLTMPNKTALVPTPPSRARLAID